MEAANFFLVGALASAAGAGYFCLRAPIAHAYGSVLAAFALPTDARRKVMCQKIFVQGVRVLYPVATKLLLIRPVHALVSDCMESLREKGRKEVRAQALVSSVLASLVLFSLVVLFQLITLPVEFNASARALRVLEGQNLLMGNEMDGARKVLKAAALTYVAALFSSILQLLRLILITQGSGRRRD